MDATARIKNLSIALERLSRIVGQQQYFNSIETLLKHEIDKAWQENYPAQTSARPAKLTTFNNDPF